MVGKSTLKIYELTEINEYFEMIILSRINGQRKQTLQQYNKLSSDQKEQFRSYYKNNNFSSYSLNDFLIYITD